MKRITADRADEPWLVARRVAITRRSDAGVAAHVVLVAIDRVSEPQYVERDGQEVCIADDGYLWIHHVPYKAHHVLTTMFDETGAIVQWRIDTCAMTGVSMNGIPWFDPLPLSVAVSPDREAAIVGSDALAEAATAAKITTHDHDLAVEESRRVIEAVRAGDFPALNLGELHRSELLRFVN
jgi:uncharacterized protein